MGLILAIDAKGIGRLTLAFGTVLSALVWTDKDLDHVVSSPCLYQTSQGRVGA